MPARGQRSFANVPVIAQNALTTEPRQASCRSVGANTVFRLFSFFSFFFFLQGQGKGCYHRFVIRFITVDRFGRVYRFLFSPFHLTRGRHLSLSVRWAEGKFLPNQFQGGGKFPPNENAVIIPRGEGPVYWRDPAHVNDLRGLRVTCSGDPDVGGGLLSVVFGS